MYIQFLLVPQLISELPLGEQSKSEDVKLLLERSLQRLVADRMVRERMGAGGRLWRLDVWIGGVAGMWGQGAGEGQAGKDGLARL